MEERDYNLTSLDHESRREIYKRIETNNYHENTKKKQQKILNKMILKGLHQVAKEA